MHYTPTYSSWINQVERWFAELTRQLIDAATTAASKRSRRTSVPGSTVWNENPKPFVWTKTAEQILDALGRLIKRINGAGH